MNRRRAGPKTGSRARVRKAARTGLRRSRTKGFSFPLQGPLVSADRPRVVVMVAALLVAAAIVLLAYLIALQVAADPGPTVAWLLGATLAQLLAAVVALEGTHHA